MPRDTTALTLRRVMNRGSSFGLVALVEATRTEEIPCVECRKATLHSILSDGKSPRTFAVCTDCGESSIVVGGELPPTGQKEATDAAS